MADNIEKLREKVEKDPKSRLFVPLAEEYRKSNMLEEAIKVLKKGIESQPGYVSARVALGKIYIEKGMTAEAVEEFEKVVKSAPDNLFAHKKLAEIYKAAGRADMAGKELRTLLKLNPMDEEARAELESLEFGQKREGMVLEATRFGESVSGTEVSGPEEEIEAVEVQEAAEEEEIEAVEVQEAAEEEEIEAVEVQEAAEEEEIEAVEVPKETFDAAYEAQGLVEAQEFIEAGDVSSEEGPETSRPPAQGWVDPLLNVSHADSYIKAGEYFRAMRLYAALLRKEPGNREVMQRRAELKALLKLIGKDKEVLMVGLGSFSKALRRRGDEFFGSS